MKYTLDLPQASFEGGFATKTGWAMVYPVDPITKEYLGEPTMEYCMEGVTVAAFAYHDAPEIKPGMAIFRGESGWEYLEDHRGEIYWVKETGDRVEINIPGKLSDEFTKLEPKEGQIWKDGGWVSDTAYFESKLADERSKIMDDILAKSKAIRTKVALGSATDAEKAVMEELSAYLEAVNSVTVVNGTYTLPKAPDFLTR